MTDKLTPEEAARRVFMGDAISPTREEWLQEGVRDELVSQLGHWEATQDFVRAKRCKACIEGIDHDFGIDAQKILAEQQRPQGRFVTPKAFLLGYSTANMRGIKEYLQYTGQEEFLQALDQAARDGVEPGEALVSLFAKLCYKSLIVGENANISQVRDIKGNLRGTQRSARGSVFEHISLSFVVTDCSRVYTHEQVRHRVGTAYSQTSGRYCRIEPGKLQLVLDPILEGCEDLLEEALETIERTVYLIECRKGLRKPPAEHPDAGDRKCLSDSVGGFPEDRQQYMWVPTGKEDGVDFGYKKKLTSAARRIAPNGQSNEMGMTLNVRTLRHTIMMRTSRYAEWEIRAIFAEIYKLAKAKWPLMFADAKEELVEGLPEITGMKMNPYERQLSDYEDNELWGELYRRGVVQAELAPIKPSEYPMNGIDNIKLLQEMGRRSLIVQDDQGNVGLGEGVDQSFLSAKHQGDQAPQPSMEQLTGGEVVELDPAGNPDEETDDAQD